ncbi:hypothetical protein [Nitrosovibrio sp. Nv17]|jgi:hypothetical protein|uniref:hypothetical protein n=1 Tax=Nitrosovibrio sp. Nv17 TaxID=1855339 RepID=UPI000908A531|nr:hypothetical protein [Nitrosovibrio sp. Nv17]SFW19941.1 hypothetical protein SAMN05216414_10593 [Nitrosovibrio sp. Nv17]
MKKLLSTLSAIALAATLSSGAWAEKHDGHHGAHHDGAHSKGHSGHKGHGKHGAKHESHADKKHDTRNGTPAAEEQEHDEKAERKQ